MPMSATSATGVTTHTASCGCGFVRLGDVLKTTPGRYFIDLVKREAARQGIDLGFRRDTVTGLSR
jgi:hypothetical protein